MDLAEMNIPALDALVNDYEGQIKVIRAQQKAAHDMAEKKLLLEVPTATPLDQVMTPSPSTDLAAWMRGLPQAAIDFIKGSK
jgi:hypothetical protein